MNIKKFRILFVKFEDSNFLWSWVKISWGHDCFQQCYFYIKLLVYFMQKDILKLTLKERQPFCCNDYVFLNLIFWHSKSNWQTFPCQKNKFHSKHWSDSWTYFQVIGWFHSREVSFLFLLFRECIPSFSFMEDSRVIAVMVQTLLICKAC